jgi:hypothetical protein
VKLNLAIVVLVLCAFASALLGKRIQSFWFRCSEYRSDALCLSFDGYQVSNCRNQRRDASANDAATLRTATEAWSCPVSLRTGLQPNTYQTAVNL